MNRPEIYIREANINDIPTLQEIRNSVKENVLSNPNRVTNSDIENKITKHGKGWVCILNKDVVGFSIVDFEQNNIWALFVKPSFEQKGNGKKLLNNAINWYFNKSNLKLWLSTEVNTRAELFYKKQGWQPEGIKENGEMRFELSFDNWQKIWNGKNSL